MFEADGLDGASMRAIAEAAGYTAAALYFHFPSKEAVYGAVLEQSLERIDLGRDGRGFVCGECSTGVAGCGSRFFDFYAGNPRDLDLGSYLFRGGMRPRGLSQELDQRLNAKLISALAPSGPRHGISARARPGRVSSRRKSSRTLPACCCLIIPAD